MKPPPIRLGCAGWSISREWAREFPGQGTHLERYARRLPAVEINSSFYRPHRPTTYERWAASVPAEFRFAVKVPKRLTHEARLADPAPLDGFLAGVRRLGEKLGPLLVQLPPSLAFDAEVAGAFFAALRRLFGGQVVCEPRHGSWFEPAAEELLAGFQVARAAADPARVPAAAEPGAWGGLVYYRLHGSPRMYYSAYDQAYLAGLATRLTRSAATAPTWCILDNTAAGAATGNALDLLRRLDQEAFRAEPGP